MNQDQNLSEGGAEVVAIEGGRRKEEEIVILSGEVVITTTKEGRLQAIADTDNFFLQASMVPFREDGSSPTKQFVDICIRAKDSMSALLFAQYEGDINRVDFCNKIIANFANAYPNIGFSKANNTFLLK